jgi:hypothetical protein
MMSDEEVHALHLTRGKFTNAARCVLQKSSNNRLREITQTLLDTGMMAPYYAFIEPTS